MSAAAGPAPAWRLQAHPPRLALLGTGLVGRALVLRWLRLDARGVPLPRLALLANSRGVLACGRDPLATLHAAADLPRRAPAAVDTLERCVAGDVVVDATASDEVAAHHAGWLARGLHVVTANKLGGGGPWSRAQAIAQARLATGAHYGDAATVGAGLPLLRSLRALVAGGDRIHAIEGVLSGSLAWLFDRYDGTRPFSCLVREACAAGYTEPDPRIDLSGEDVRRKLLILARAAGIALEADAVRVEPLLDGVIAGAQQAVLDTQLAALDDVLRDRWQAACRDGAKLRFIARFDRERAEVGLRALPAAHPLCAGGGTDNRVAISSCRYAGQPLLIQGPGAGAEVTAAALLDDVLRIAGPQGCRTQPPWPLS